jgi:tetratricopeptide (TPR) repeat protein
MRCRFFISQTADMYGLCAPHLLILSLADALAICCGRRYGIGQILFREEQYDKALQHFRMAAGINSRSSVLACYQGMALAKLGRHSEALSLLQVCQILLRLLRHLFCVYTSCIHCTTSAVQRHVLRLGALQPQAAIASDSKNPLARYERASILAAMGHDHEALAELTALKVCLMCSIRCSTVCAVRCCLKFICNWLQLQSNRRKLLPVRPAYIGRWVSCTSACGRLMLP